MLTSPAMGNNSSRKRTKVPKQIGKKRPPDMDKALGKQPFFSHFRQKPGVSGGWEGACGDAGSPRAMDDEVRESLLRRRRVPEGHVGMNGVLKAQWRG